MNHSPQRQNLLILSNSNLQLETSQSQAIQQPHIVADRIIKSCHCPDCNGNRYNGESYCRNPNPLGFIVTLFEILPGKPEPERCEKEANQVDDNLPGKSCCGGYCSEPSPAIRAKIDR